MARSTISSRGQTVIPKPVRTHLGLHAGDEVEFVILDGGEVLLKPETENVRSLKGVLRKPGRKPVSLRAMREAVRRRGGKE